MSFRYHTNLVLKNVNLEILRGQTVALIGESGSGKSTLLHCLAGLDDPDGGTVRVMQQVMSRQPEINKTRLRAAYLGIMRQKDNLISHLTVAENIALARSLATNSRPSNSDNILDRIGIAKRATSLPAQLSGGELARAGLAIALACNPVILLLDEPTGEVDGETESSILDLLNDYQRDGGAVVIATHNPAVARRATQVLKMDAGKISHD